MTQFLPEKPATLVPEGRYPARAVEWKLAQASTGNEQVVVSFAFSHESRAVERLWFGHFTDATWARTIDALKTMGWKGNDVLELDTPQADLSSNEVVLVLEHEFREEKMKEGDPPRDPNAPLPGRWVERIRWVNAKGGVDMTTPLAVEKRAAFSQRMKGLILSSEQGQARPNGGPRNVPAARGEPPPHTDLDRPPV